MDPSPPSPAATLVREEPRTRIERVGGEAGAVLRKTYLSPPGLLWRTFLRRSRARREHDSLAALTAAGVPCIRPVRWAEQRVLGCVRSCTVETGFVDGARDLQSVLRGERDPSRRRALAVKLGRLLHRLHDAGYCSGTLSLRNVLVAGDPAGLCLCDQPYAAPLGRGWLARLAADLDLYDAFFSPNRRREWSATERWRGVLACCDGDARAAGRIWRRLAGLPQWAFRLNRQSSRLPFVRWLARLSPGGAPVRREEVA